jgi:hypothetical protein
MLFSNPYKLLIVGAKLLDFKYDPFPINLGSSSLPSRGIRRRFINDRRGAQADDTKTVEL